MNKFCKIVSSPVGNLGIEVSDLGLERLTFFPDKLLGEFLDHHLIEQCEKELSEYFVGNRKVFDIKLNLIGTQFQKEIWLEMLKIPFGQVVSYQDLAIKINRPKACRAVGGANNQNKIAIIIPCHRVIGKNGTLTGFAPGLEYKEYLLRHEGIL